MDPDCMAAFISNRTRINTKTEMMVRSSPIAERICSGRSRTPDASSVVSFSIERMNRLPRASRATLSAATLAICRAIEADVNPREGHRLEIACLNCERMDDICPCAS